MIDVRSKHKLVRHEGAVDRGYARHLLGRCEDVSANRAFSLNGSQLSREEQSRTPEKKSQSTISGLEAAPGGGWGASLVAIMGPGGLLHLHGVVRSRGCRGRRAYRAPSRGTRATDRRSARRMVVSVRFLPSPFFAIGHPMLSHGGME